MGTLGGLLAGQSLSRFKIAGDMSRTLHSCSFADISCDCFQEIQSKKGSQELITLWIERALSLEDCLSNKLTMKDAQRAIQKAVTFVIKPKTTSRVHVQHSNL